LPIDLFYHLKYLNLTEIFKEAAAFWEVFKRKFFEIYSSTEKKKLDKGLKNVLISIAKKLEWVSESQKSFPLDLSGESLGTWHLTVEALSGIKYLSMN
jgi:hypothetical protein